MSGISERGNECLVCINLFIAKFYLRMLSTPNSTHCRITELRRAVGKQCLKFVHRNYNYNHNDIYRGHILHKVQIIFPNA